jgi:hypothetical protein
MIGGASLNFGNDCSRIAKRFEVFQRVAVILPRVATNLLRELAECVE